MDISSLIESDAAGSTSRAPHASPESRKEPNRGFTSPHDTQPEPRERFAQRGSGVEPHQHPQPPPLRPPLQNEFRSPSTSSYNSAHSPYTKTPSSALSTGQYPFPQPSTHHSSYGTHPLQHHQYEGQAFPISTAQQGHGQPLSLPQTPTSGTPGGSFPSFQQHRPPSSHSASTPTSGHAQTPILLRDSPQQNHAQIRGSYVSHPTQQYFSQPGTPLGPPTTLGRQSSGIRRESPSSYDHKRANSGGSHGQHQPSFQQANSLRNHSGLSPTAYAPMHTQMPLQQDSPINQDRERSLSVSPKTRLPSQSLPGTSVANLEHSRALDSQVTPAKRKAGESRPGQYPLEQQPSSKRSMSLGVGGMLNASDEGETNNHYHQPHGNHNRYPQPLPHNEALQSNRGRGSIGDVREDSFSSASNHGVIAPSIPAVNQQPSMNSPTNEEQAPPGVKKRLVYETHHIIRPVQAASKPMVPDTALPERASSVDQQPASQGPTVGLQNPPKTSKRRERYREVPIFAQSARQKDRGGIHINGQRQVVGKSPLQKQQQPPNDMSHASTKQDINGLGMSRPDAVQPELESSGLLGPWEPTITNVIPAEELTREIMNYLFGSVVQMNGVVFGPAGGSTAGGGAVVEIEAKIGQIIDKNTNDRIRLPVMTECILSRTDPNLRTAFRSSMTAAQHSRLNGFLNQALTNSKPALPGEAPKKPRVPLTYVHTRETDTFYELSPNAINTLPPSVQAYLDRRNRPKVRITTDQKTGKEMAKIIKVRVSDIEVYSPQTPFDWRVSVSLEVNYDGDTRDLVEMSEGKERKKADRNKDRVSYKHSHYQIDLTQVKAAEANAKVEKEHELEIEVSSAAVRDQGQLVLQGQPNKYEELIKGFVDNVRTLVRYCRE
ncbi:MAG: hypothetical protein Q9219_004072 [cf. Caloplaca sp. 3 TL-2023]